MRSKMIRDDKNRSFTLRLPETSDPLAQDQEWFDVEIGGRRHRLRLHDYAAIYAIPGLYEALVYERLRCRSPETIVGLLCSTLEESGDPAGLRVLDLGAGNGIVAEHLRDAGVRHIVGLDLIPEAATAARRDRPGAYDDYVVADLTDLRPADEAKLRDHKLNCLVSVAALGFGDIPPEAYLAALKLIADDGWIAMTIKEDFLARKDESGFGRLLRHLIDENFVEVCARQRYCHRVSINGEELLYVAIVARKRRSLDAVDPQAWNTLTTTNRRDNMFTVSDEARSFLAGAAGALNEDECFRLARGDEGKIELVTGTPSDDDITVEHENRTILALESDLADELKDRKVDVEQTQAGKRGLVLV